MISRDFQTLLPVYQLDHNNIPLYIVALLIKEKSFSSDQYYYRTVEYKQGIGWITSSGRCYFKQDMIDDQVIDWFILIIIIILNGWLSF